MAAQFVILKKQWDELRMRLFNFGWLPKAVPSLGIGGQEFEQFANVVLRIPGLILLEYWCQIVQSSFATEATPSETFDSGGLVFHFAAIIGIVILLLPLEKLVPIYMNCISLALLYASNTFSRNYVNKEQELAGVVAGIKVTDIAAPSLWERPPKENTSDADFLWRQSCAMGIHMFVAAVISTLLDLSVGVSTAISAYSFPVAVRLLGFPITSLHLWHSAATMVLYFISALHVLNKLPAVFDFARQCFCDFLHSCQTTGLVDSVTVITRQVFKTQNLIVFWQVMFFTHLYKHLAIPDTEWMVHQWYILVILCMTEICVSPLSLMATCITISELSRFILKATKLYLHAGDGLENHDPLWMGEGFTMAILAFQTGLISQKLQQRMATMAAILFVVLSSQVQAMYEVSEPIIMSFGAARHKTLRQHFRAFVLCLVMFVFPLYLTLLIYFVFGYNFWTQIVTVTCSLTSVQVAGLTIIYVLLIRDARQETPSEDLDDTIYYVKTAIRIIEFFVALVVVATGLSESLHGEFSILNGVVLGAHCYFNIWQRLQVGWKAYLLRREAAGKIESMPQATGEQLDAHDDVCPICYHEMKSAIITSCRHFFHCLCLRKWLYVSDKCPCCFQKLVVQESESEGSSTS